MCIWFAAVSWRLWQPQHLTSRGGNISPMTTGRRLQVFMTILCDICTPSVCLQICCVQDCVQLLPLPHRIPPLLKSPISTMLQRLIHSCVGSMVIMSWAETQLSMKNSRMIILDDQAHQQMTLHFQLSLQCNVSPITGFVRHTSQCQWQNQMRDVLAWGLKQGLVGVSS